MSKAQRIIAKAFLRSILRASRALETSCHKRGLNAKVEILSRVPTSSALQHLRDTQSPVCRLVVNEFRINRGLTDQADIAEALNDCSRASRRMWNRAQQLQDPDWPGRSDSVQFHVGLVATHKLYGYRLAIAGWTPQCDADPLWVHANGVDKLPLGTRQPFYNCKLLTLALQHAPRTRAPMCVTGLVDERDRPGAQVTYVAQENIVPSAAPAPVLHAAVESTFDAWQPGLGYVPGPAALKAHPEDSFVAPALAHSAAAGGTVDAAALRAHLPPVRKSYAELQRQQARAEAEAATWQRQQRGDTK